MKMFSTQKILSSIVDRSLSKQDERRYLNKFILRAVNN